MHNTKARYIMIGGFLGAGKTTAILKLGEHLTARGLRVGLITNDQSVDLVDTARARAQGFAVEEITGGCFCCMFDSLVDASRHLSAATRPEVLIAEPVGSCTDLKATVSYPLRQLYGDDYHVAPLSVLVDPGRCARILGIEQGRSFSDKVVYVYEKQLEEAEILVINKADLLDVGQRQRLREALAKRFPQARLMEISAKSGEGMAAWLGHLMSDELGRSATMEVDYDVYADGEARLGWLNAKGPVASPQEFDGNAWLTDLADRLRQRLAAGGIEIAHLKMTLAPSEGPDLAAVSVTASEREPHLTHTLKSPLPKGELVINLRAEADPERLEQHVREAIAAIAPVAVSLTVLAAFKPGRPNPTHRVANAD